MSTVTPIMPGCRAAFVTDPPIEVAARLRRIADELDAGTLDVADAIGQVEAAKTRLLLAQLSSAMPASLAGDDDPTVDVQEAATLLGMSRTWLYRNAKKLPFTRRVGARSVRFSVAGIRRYLAARRPA